MKALRVALHWLFTWAVVLLILFEEWGWDPLARAVARLARVPGLAWAERRIAGLPPWGAAVALGVPALALLPVKLLALAAIAAGHAAAGVSVVVLAKLLGTGLVAWLFGLTRPALMRLAWFGALYPRWIAWKRRVVDEVRASPPWLAGRRLKRRLRVRAGRWWQRHG